MQEANRVSDSLADRVERLERQLRGWQLFFAVALGLGLWHFTMRPVSSGN